ncbi:MAG: hypothetical protein KGI75_30725 [Rhizobiaceae bacterium]|nr:hypothetical protein [Rhizobiaceae bacterium]
MIFYFYLKDIDAYEVDHVGIELALLNAAVREAIRASRETVAEIVLLGEAVDGRTFENADGHGAILRTVVFRGSLGIDKPADSRNAPVSSSVSARDKL